MGINQRVFDVLGININLINELKEKSLIILSEEQKKAAEKENYTFSVIVPGHLPRQELIQKIKAYFSQKFYSEGIYFYSQDYLETKQAQNSARSRLLYQILLKGNQETDQAHPETMAKTFYECQKMLVRARLAHPQLNLRGLTLEEYLLAQVTLDQSQKAHFESETTTWLLEEQILAEDGNAISCLRAYWRAAALGVGSCQRANKRPKRGARFAVVPKFPSAGGPRTL